MEFITNLFSNDKVLSGLFANLDLIKLSYTFGGLLFIFSAAKVFYINFGLLEDDKPTWKVFLFNTYLFAMGFCYSEAAKLLPEKSQPNDAEKLFSLAVLGIIVGIKAYRKIYGLNGYRQSFYANIWAPIKYSTLISGHPLSQLFCLSFLFLHLVCLVSSCLSIKIPSTV